jgi:D-3-phosphoglycerate dehydrogenase
MGAIRKELNDLLKESDFVSLHLPHTKETHYLLNKKNLSLMKKNAYLINCSRGGTVDEEALYEILNEGKMAGAGVDVFENEPPSKENKLLKLDNILLTPHIGANTKEAQIRAGTICAEQIMKVLQGKKPDFCVNADLL